ncbi:hypothetical protein [Bradyrhizobium jicamae]|nr:hypothetical protein [Bradyrhizobium jicamae]
MSQQGREGTFRQAFFTLVRENPTQDQLTGVARATGLSFAPQPHSIHGEGRSFLVSTQTPEHSGISFDDQQWRRRAPHDHLDENRIRFRGLIGFVTGVLLCVGVLLLMELNHFPEERTPDKQAVHQRKQGGPMMFARGDRAM